MPTEEDVEAIRVAIREASRLAWTELRSAKPSESFYYFGLWTTSVVHRPAPTAVSCEGLAAVASEYAARGSDASEEDLRWSHCDSPYDLFGDHHFASVAELFIAIGDPYERPDAVNEALLDALVGALADLDREGFFGVGSERDRVVVNVTMPGEEDELSILSRARKLNPRSALRLYERDHGAEQAD